MLHDFEQTLQFASDEEKTEIVPIIVERDYTKGHGTIFDVEMPDIVRQAHTGISEQEWKETVETINGFLSEAEKFDWFTIWSNLLICTTCYSAMLCLPNRYEQCLDDAWSYLQKRNASLFTKHDLYWQDPRLNGLIQLSILRRITPDQKKMEETEAEGDSTQKTSSTAPPSMVSVSSASALTTVSSTTSDVSNAAGVTELADGVDSTAKSSTSPSPTRRRKTENSANSKSKTARSKAAQSSTSTGDYVGRPKRTKQKKSQ